PRLLPGPDDERRGRADGPSRRHGQEPLLLRPGEPPAGAGRSRCGMTPCREYRESIAALVLGALPPSEVTPLRAHLASCEECDRYHEEMMSLPPLLDLAGGVDGLAVEAPPGLEDRIARRVAAEGGTRKRPRRLRRPILAGVGGLALGAAATL